MKCAVYGGSFNPPHIAHAMIISWLLWSGRAEQVLIVPVFRYAFEGVHEKKLQPFDLRLAWAKSAFSQFQPHVEILDIERHLPSPSYTIDTLNVLQKKRPNDDLFLVLGADSRSSLHAWKGWEEIESKFSPVFVGREGYSSDDLIVFPNISSTMIRAQLRKGIIPTDLIGKALQDILTTKNPFLERE